jgi:hypothetical protein
MNETLLTISLSIIVVCNLGVLWLYLRLKSYIAGLQMDDLDRMILDRLSEAADRQRGMKHALLEDGKLTRQRISQVKTRMTDDEKDDQKSKAKPRRPFYIQKTKEQS